MTYAMKQLLQSGKGYRAESGNYCTEKRIEMRGFEVSKEGCNIRQN